jgi:hypothetical protein
MSACRPTCKFINHPSGSKIKSEDFHGGTRLPSPGLAKISEVATVKSCGLGVLTGSLNKSALATPLILGLHDHRPARKNNAHHH